MRRFLKIAGWTVGGILALAILLLLVIYLALQSGAGQKLLSEKAMAAVPGLTLEGLSGSPPSHFTIQKIAMADTQGVWLRIENAELRWHPLAALHGRYNVDSLTVAKIALDRLPVTEKKPKIDNDRPFEMPTLPDVRIGKLQVGRLELAAAVTGGKAQVLSAEGSVEEDKEDATAANLSVQTLEGIPTTATLQARLSDERIQGQLNVEEAANGTLGHVFRLDGGKPLHLALTADGALPQWKVRLNLLSGDQSMLVGQASATPQEHGTAYQADWTGTLPPGLFAQLPQLSSLGKDFDGKAEGRISRHGRIELSKATLNLSGLTLDARGKYEGDEGAASLDLIFRSASIAPFSGLAGRPLDGPLALEVEIKGRMDALAATAHLSSDRLSLGNMHLGKTESHFHAILDAWQWQQNGMGPLAADGDLLTTLNATPIDLSYGVALDQAGLLTIKRLVLQSGKGRLQAGGDVALSEGRVKALVQAENIRVATLAPGAGLDGEVNGTVTLDGAADDMNITTDLAATKLSGLPGGLADLSGGRLAMTSEATLVDQQELHVTKSRLDAGALALDATGNYALSTQSLDATLKGQVRKKDSPPLDLAATLAIKDKLLTLQEAKLSAPGMAMDASAKVNLATKLIDGNILLNASDLSALSALAGQKIGGQAKLQARLAAEGERQTLDLSGNAGQLQIGATTVGQAQLAARASDLFNLAGVQASVNAQQLKSGTVRLAKLNATAQTMKAKSGEVVTIAADTAGAAAGSPLKLNLNVSLAQQKERRQITFAGLKGAYAGKPLSLQQPSTLRIGPQDMTLSPLRVIYGTGTIAFEGGVANGKADLKGTVAQMPLSALSPGMDGMLGASLNVTGAANAPTANLTAAVEMREEPSLPPASLSAQATINKGKLDATAKASVKQGGSVTADVHLPVRFSLQPFAFDLSPNAPLSGEAKLAMALDALNPWLRRQGQEVTGRADGTIALGGTLAQPDLKGQVRLTDGTYEGLQSGICLKGIDGTLEGSRSDLRLSRLTAGDGQGGTLAASGEVAFGEAGSVNSSVSLKRLKLFCRGPASGEVAGDLAIQGTLTDMLAKGALTLGPLAIQLPEAAGSSIPQIAVRRLGEKPNPAAGRPGPTVRLDLAVDAPDRVFVRGRGLDAEFQGKLQIGGTAASPDVNGKLSTKRGRFDLLDRPLSLSRAEITFTGKIPPSPYLDILAESKVQDTTISVALTGPAQKPSLALTSSPALPQDELLARLLFGRDLKSITPFQAIQLAQSAAALAGKSSGPGILDKARDALGVDTLTLDQGADNSTTVGAGKYINDRVYVGVQQGATPESREVKTEIEVTPSISAGTTTDAQGRTGANVNWKWDY